MGMGLLLAFNPFTSGERCANKINF